jgi:predicted Zn-dependent protease
MTSAIRLNIPQTANGKRESFDHGVYTRQTNTFFSAGKRTKQELLER